MVSVIHISILNDGLRKLAFENGTETVIETEMETKSIKFVPPRGKIKDSYCIKINNKIL